jgi:hypothetical protein
MMEEERIALLINPSAKVANINAKEKFDLVHLHQSRIASCAYMLVFVYVCVASMHTCVCARVFLCMCADQPFH